MAPPDEMYETPKRRTLLLLIGFAVLIGIGVVTVVQPELEDEPEEDAMSEVEPSETDEIETPVQE
jgi:hypothetical protein